MTVQLFTPVFKVASTSCKVLMSQLATVQVPEA